MVTIEPATYEPIIGENYKPVTLTASSDLIRAYVNGTGDAGFGRHAGAMRLATGLAIAPPTIFDRDLGTRLVGNTGGDSYGLHAKQSFEFRRPIEEGVTYTIIGKLSDSYTRNEIGYATVESVCSTPNGEPAIISTYTRAYKFPGNRYKHKPGDVAKPTVSVFLEQNEARLDAKFPDVGSVLEGAPKIFTQALMNLYSGPSSNIHTDRKVAQRRGHPDAIIQGLMSTELECELYREVFGPAWYTGGKISVKYISNMMSNCCLTPIGVVASNKGGELELRTAVYNEKLELTVVGSVTVRI